jgi:nicotinamidase/pyrazinamidase
LPAAGGGAKMPAMSMGKRALVVVDVQNDFCPGGALEVKRGDEVVEVVNRLARHFDRVVATQDWHPPDHGSFAANHPGKQPYEVIDLHGIEQVLWPVHCVQATPGAELHPRLDRARFHQVFPKGTDPAVDSYSGFYDNERRRSTGLADWLRAEGVDRVYVLGLATDYCVKYTAVDAQREGFTTYLIEDGCRGVELEPGDSDRAIEEMRGAGVVVIDSGAIGP